MDTDFTDQGLERRVAERTAQLEAANKELHREIAEHKQTEETLQRRNRDLALLNRASQAISSTLDLDQVLINLQIMDTQVNRFDSTDLTLIEPLAVSAAIETSPDPISLTDLNANFIMVNRRAVALHGFGSAREMIGASAFDLISPEDRLRAAENARRVPETGGVREVKYTLLRKDGTRFHAELSVSLIVGAKGEPKAFIGITVTMSQQKCLPETCQAQDVGVKPATGICPATQR